MVGAIIVCILLGVIIWIALRRNTKATARSVPTNPSPKETTSPNSRAASIPDRDEYFDVGDLFFCDTARSPDGHYLVGANDGYIDERGRRRNGACALKDMRTGNICFKTTITRGNNPHVCNDGLVIVEDWKNENLSGALIAFKRDGERLWAKHFKANIYTSGLSADGCRAFVSTANSDYEAHSGKTFFLNMANGDVIWIRDGWGDVRFEANSLVVELDQTDGTKRCFPFDETGLLPSEYDDALNAIQQERERGQYWAVLPKVQVAMKNAPPDIKTAKELIAELDGKDASIPEPSRARLLRLRGEVAEAEGDVAQALKLWQQALQLDPKVGIRRRYEILVKSNT